MQTYRTNSPQAAARLVAMALVSDGQYALSELQALDRLDAAQRLGLSAEAFQAVIDRFCQELLQASGGVWTGVVDDATRARLMAEVTDPALQDLIVQQCEALMLADGHLAGGEIALIDALSARWRRPVRL
jgi:hypothetical protein